MFLSLAIGMYYTLNAFLPITFWYGKRRPPTLAMPNNFLYKLSWYVFFSLHFMAFMPMALLWPATYIGSDLILDFYDLANFYLGTIGALGIITIVSLMWMISILFYQTSDVITRGSIFQEMILYITVELLAWTYTVKLYPRAHTDFYYANETNLNPNPEGGRPLLDPESIDLPPRDDELFV